MVEKCNSYIKKAPIFIGALYIIIILNYSIGLRSLIDKKMKGIGNTNMLKTVYSTA